MVIPCPWLSSHGCPNDEDQQQQCPCNHNATSLRLQCWPSTKFLIRSSLDPTRKNHVPCSNKNWWATVVINGLYYIVDIDLYWLTTPSSTVAVRSNMGRLWTAGPTIWFTTEFQEIRTATRTGGFTIKYLVAQPTLPGDVDIYIYTPCLMVFETFLGLVTNSHL